MQVWSQSTEYTCPKCSYKGNLIGRWLLGYKGECGGCGLPFFIGMCWELVNPVTIPIVDAEEPPDPEQKEPTL